MAEASEVTMFCPACGSRLDPAWKFCGSCGRCAAATGSTGVPTVPGVALQDLELRAAIRELSQIERVEAHRDGYSERGHEPTIRHSRSQPLKSPGVATVLSFFWAGLGQCYNGQIGKGIAFMMAYGVSLLLISLAIGIFTTPVLWVWGMADANTSAKNINLEMGA